ncbi:MAG: hypothetical protein L7S72_05030, partial [Flavobacteriales bacterium]|nr:hypothetical protein [Flavobacteriales bacterium]
MSNYKNYITEVRKRIRHANFSKLQNITNTNKWKTTPTSVKRKILGGVITKNVHDIIVKGVSNIENKNNRTLKLQKFREHNLISNNDSDQIKQRVTKRLQGLREKEKIVNERREKLYEIQRRRALIQRKEEMLNEFRDMLSKINNNNKNNKFLGNRILTYIREIGHVCDHDGCTSYNLDDINEKYSNDLKKAAIKFLEKIMNNGNYNSNSNYEDIQKDMHILNFINYNSNYNSSHIKHINSKWRKKNSETKKKRAKAEANRRAKAEANRRAKEEANRRSKEEANRKAKAEANRKAKEEVNRKAKEEANRKAKEEANRKAKEEANRKAKEEDNRRAKAEAEANRKAKEEANRYKKNINKQKYYNLSIKYGYLNFMRNKFKKINQATTKNDIIKNLRELQNKIQLEKKKQDDYIDKLNKLNSLLGVLDHKSRLVNEFKRNNPKTHKIRPKYKKLMKEYNNYRNRISSVMRIYDNTKLTGENFKKYKRVYDGFIHARAGLYRSKKEEANKANRKAKEEANRKAKEEAKRAKENEEIKRAKERKERENYQQRIKQELYKEY